MDNPINWFQCSICTNKTRFSYLKAQLCRSCAAFYRRAIIEELEYECCMDYRCKSINKRSFCRLCRFNKCVQLGATLGLRDKKRAESNNELEKKRQEAGTSKALALLPPPLKQSKLADLMHGYDSFLMGQRYLALCSNPELEFNKMIEIDSRPLMVEIENTSLPLMLSYFYDYYRIFSRIPIDKQIEIAAQVGFDFITYHRLHLTSQHFPQADDYFNIMLSNGHYMNCDSTKINKSFKKILKKGRHEDFYRGVFPIAIKQTLNCRDFKLMQLQKRDVVCIMFMSVFKHIEYSGLMTEEMKRFEEDLFKEWYEEIKEEYGPTKATERFRSIMQFYITCSNFYEEFKNLYLSTYLQGFYSDETPLVIDYCACLRYLDAAKNNENTTYANQTSKFMEKFEPPVDELDDYYNPEFGKLFIDSILSATSHKGKCSTIRSNLKNCELEIVELRKVDNNTDARFGAIGVFVPGQTL